MSRVTNAILTTHVSEGADQLNCVTRFIRETELGGNGARRRDQADGV